MMMEPSHHDLVDWNREGTVIVIKNVHGFSEKVLPQYFKHSNYASFVRQLNMYGFTRALNMPQAFKHHLFQRGKKEKLSLMKRKLSQPKQDLTALSNKYKADLERAQQDLEAMRERQQRFDEEVTKLKGQNAHLDKENAMLWQVVEEARGRQQLLAQKMKQIMSFLYGAFMNRDGKVQLETISEALPMILDSAKDAGVEIEELSNGDNQKSANALFAPDQGSAQGASARSGLPAPPRSRMYDEHRPHETTSTRASSSGVPKGFEPPSGANHSSRQSHPPPQHIQQQQQQQQQQHSGEDEEDDSDFVRLDSSLLRMPTLTGDSLLDYSNSNQPGENNTAGALVSPNGPSNDLAPLLQQPRTRELSSSSSRMMKDLPSPSPMSSDPKFAPENDVDFSAETSMGAPDLARADSLVRGASLQSFLDLVESSKAKNGNAEDDLHRHLDIAKELDQYMNEQDNTLQRMNTIESQLSQAQGPHFDNDGDSGIGDDPNVPDFFTGDDDVQGASSESTNLSPSKRREPDSPDKVSPGDILQDGSSSATKKRKTSFDDGVI
ncbi:Heat shock transcription factor [Hondaea fermentalgiana]|uniref:Heat shock transcription factor n=1 Tax=Hondaea fermentalgiana TaxID=2315210 RepID=A0A2R5G7B7_9STRA|nr:Heat shock transcription factor [Hondaea fermentalgiana]|eukprot:GBG26219.1 Heat shock transcription factor [Hondaea fermentalgiana]